MTDFETLIRSMMADGTSLEEVTKMTNSVLDTIATEKKKLDSRASVLDHFKNIFNESYEKDNLEIADAAALCVLVCADSYPEWGPKEIQEFYTTMDKNIHMAADIVGKDPGQALRKLLGDLSDAISDGFNEVKTSCHCNKRERKDTAGPTGNTSPCTNKVTFKTPEDRLIDFINSL